MKQNNAVSPVVGVMLMLMVTIVLAAAISGSIGGFMGDYSEAGHVTVISYVGFEKNLTGGKLPEALIFEHQAGDPLQLSGMEIQILGTVLPGGVLQTQFNTTGSPYRLENLAGNKRTLSLGERVRLNNFSAANYTPGQTLSYMVMDSARTILSSGEFVLSE